jgi:hypothetical protein
MEYSDDQLTPSNAIFSRSLDEENGVQATVVLGVVGDLCIATPDDLSSSSYETKFRNVHFDDGTLG